SGNDPCVRPAGPAIKSNQIHRLASANPEGRAELSSEAIKCGARGTLQVIEAFLAQIIVNALVQLPWLQLIERRHFGVLAQRLERVKDRAHLASDCPGSAADLDLLDRHGSDLLCANAHFHIFTIALSELRSLHDFDGLTFRAADGLPL